jgi:hypothetical protein
LLVVYQGLAGVYVQTHFRHVFIIFVLKTKYLNGKINILTYSPVICTGGNFNTCIVNSFHNYTPIHREGAILQSPCSSVRPSVCPSVHTFVTDISASTGRNDFIFDIWLWHSDLYHVSPFQVYRTSTSCLPCDLQMNEWG